MGSYRVMYKIRRGTAVRVSDSSLNLTNHRLRKDFLCPRAAKVDTLQEMEFNPSGRESRFVDELERDGYIVFTTTNVSWPFIVVVRTRVMSLTRMGRGSHWDDMADTRGRR